MKSSKKSDRGSDKIAASTQKAAAKLRNQEFYVWFGEIFSHQSTSNSDRIPPHSP